MFTRSDREPDLFMDRRDAGRKLADALKHLKNEKPVVLALPRGGVPVAYEVAKALEAPLDLLMVRKIGAPGHEEYAAGAVVDGPEPQMVINQSAVRSLNISPEYLEEVKQRELEEIKRRRAKYLKDHPHVPVEGRTVILVDDGIATGSTARAAMKGLKQLNAKRTILAMPVAPGDTVEKFRADGYEVVCLASPAYFYAVGQQYRRFGQTQDEEVISLLQKARDEWMGNAIAVTEKSR